MRSEEEYRRALELIEIGINDCEIGRRLGIPRGTIRDWRVGAASGSGGRTKFWSGRQSSHLLSMRSVDGSTRRRMPISSGPTWATAASPSCPGTSIACGSCVTSSTRTSSTRSPAQSSSREAASKWGSSRRRDASRSTPTGNTGSASFPTWPWPQTRSTHRARTVAGRDRCWSSQGLGPWSDPF